ncbi:hypothetical protein ACQFYA_13340 [Promicromonospora sp. Marseille-Q5078]
MTLQGDVTRPPAVRDAVGVALGAALGVMVPFVGVLVLGPWSPVVGLVVPAAVRLGVGLGTPPGSLPMLRTALSAALFGWAVVAAFMLVAILAIPVAPALD